jgi:hypothetical protein
MGIMCIIPVYLPVDQKQCALREDKYTEMLSYYAFTMLVMTKLLVIANEFLSHILYHCTPVTCKARKVFHAVCMAMLAAEHLLKINYFYCMCEFLYNM